MGIKYGVEAAAGDATCCWGSQACRCNSTPPTLEPHLAAGAHLDDGRQDGVTLPPRAHGWEPGAGEAGGCKRRSGGCRCSTAHRPTGARGPGTPLDSWPTPYVTRAPPGGCPAAAAAAAGGREPCRAGDRRRRLAPLLHLLLLRRGQRRSLLAGLHCLLPGRRVAVAASGGGVRAGARDGSAGPASVLDGCSTVPRLLNCVRWPPTSPAWLGDSPMRAWHAPPRALPGRPPPPSRWPCLSE